MRTATRLMLVTALAMPLIATACVENTEGVSTKDGGKTDGTTKGAAALTATGTYEITSDLALEASLPEKKRKVINDFVGAATNPGAWVIDKALAGSDNTVKTLVKAFLGSAIDSINSYIPSKVRDNLRIIGQGLGDATKRVTLISDISVSGSAANALTAGHTLSKVQFTLNGEVKGPYTLTLAGKVIPPVTGIGATVDATSTLSLKEHQLALTYGGLMRIALENGILPVINPAYTNLGAALADMINCDGIGVVMLNRLGSGPFGLFSASTYAEFCRAGMTYVAQEINKSLDESDDMVLKLTGSVAAVDTNADDNAEELQRGTWAGTLSVGGTSAPLTNATFRGKKR